MLLQQRMTLAMYRLQAERRGAMRRGSAFCRHAWQVTDVGERPCVRVHDLRGAEGAGLPVHPARTPGVSYSTYANAPRPRIENLGNVRSAQVEDLLVGCEPESVNLNENSLRRARESNAPRVLSLAASLRPWSGRRKTSAR